MNYLDNKDNVNIYLQNKNQRVTFSFFIFPQLSYSISHLSIILPKTIYRKLCKKKKKKKKKRGEWDEKERMTKRERERERDRKKNLEWWRSRELFRTVQL